MNKEQSDVYMRSLVEIECEACDIYKLLTILDAYREANPNCDELDYMQPVLDILLEKSLSVKKGIIKAEEYFLNYNQSTNTDS